MSGATVSLAIAGGAVLTMLGLLFRGFYLLLRDGWRE